MTNIDPRRLEWRDDTINRGFCRLHMDGRASNVIKTDMGVMEHDTFPTDLHELRIPEVLETLVMMERHGVIRTTGRLHIKHRTTEEIQALMQDTSSIPVITPEMSGAYQHRPEATTGSGTGNFSIPSMGVAETHQKEGSSIRWGRVALIGALTVSLIGGGAWAITNVMGGSGQALAESPASTHSEEAPVVSGTTTSRLGRTDPGAKVETIPIGWTDQAKWRFSLDSKSIAVSGFQDGIVISDSNSLTILNPENGSTIISVDIKGVPKFIASTTYGDNDTGIVWRIGNTLYAWSKGSGEVVYYRLSPDAQVDTDGTGTLVKQNGVSYTLMDYGLKRIVGSEGREIAVDGDHIISSKWSGPITIRDVEGNDVSESLIDPPEAGMVVNQWHGAGTGYAFISWRTSNSDPGDPKTPVTLAVHDVNTGKVVSQVKSTVELTTKVQALYGGASKEVAVGPYLFSLGDGKLLVDASADVNKFLLILSDHAYGQNKKGGVLTYIGKDKQELITPNMPITVLKDGSSVARVSPTTLALLPKQ